MNDEIPEKEFEDRRSRFVWSSSDIVIIKNPDQEANPKLDPSNPSDTDPAAAPVPTKDDDQQDR